MNLVCIESPFAGDIPRHIHYACDCLKHSIAKGEAPFASHLLYPNVLDDGHVEQRARGLAMGQAWLAKADIVAVYTDLGVSSGMQAAIRVAQGLGIPVEYRSLHNG